MIPYLKWSWAWLEARLRSPYAPLFLAAYSFIETAITLLPIDPFAIAVMSMNKRRVYTTAFFIVAGSLSGALVGYAVGHYAFGSWSAYFLDTPARVATFEHLKTIFLANEFLIVFATAFVPIPKTPTILAAGFLSGSIFWYAIAWTLGRSLHFAAEAFLVKTVAQDNLSSSMRVLTGASIVVAFGVVAYLVLQGAGLA